MISEVQEGRITDYFVSQNFSIDILIKIRDYMYQKNISLMIICSLSILHFRMKNGNYVYQFFKEHNHSEIFPLLLTLLIPFILQATVGFTLFNLSEHKIW